MKLSFFKKTDLLIFAAVLLLSLAFFIPLSLRGSAESATVRRYGEVIDTVPLGKAEERTYTFEEGSVRVLFSSDGVFVISSPCLGQDCVRTGTVKEEGSGIFCLPLGFSVTLSGEGEQDAFTG